MVTPWGLQPVHTGWFRLYTTGCKGQYLKSVGSGRAGSLEPLWIPADGGRE